MTVRSNERIIGRYETHAEAWDRQRGRRLIEKAWLDRFLALLPERGSVLDVGCGMGEPIARYIVERGFCVTGVDSSPSLIGLARQRFTDQRWMVADMRRLDLGRRFDGILAWHSLFHLSPEHQRPMFARFAAHAADNAALMFTSGPSHGESIGQWRGEPLYHGSLDPDEYRALLAQNGFALVDHRLRDPECGDAIVWVARKS